MQVALLANTEWLDEELSSFRCLTVGLIDEMVGVVQLLPEQLPYEDAIQFGKTVVYRESGFGWLLRQRLLSLAPVLEELKVDVIHGLHGDLWGAATALGAALDVPAVLTVASQTDVERAAALAKRQGVQRPTFAATTAPMAEALSRQLTGDGPEAPAAQTAATHRDAAVAIVRPGVHLRSPAEESPEQEQPACIVISGAAKVDDDYKALFAGICRLISAYSETQFFLDTIGGDNHGLWQLAGKLNLLPNLSMMPHRLGHREVELSADVIVHPQALGRSRSFTLQAMANGVPVIARGDPWLDYLIDNETAWLVHKPDPHEWEALLRRVIEQPNEARALAKRARMWVGRDHLASRQVADSLALYRRATGEDMKFTPSGTGGREIV